MGDFAIEKSKSQGYPAFVQLSTVEKVVSAAKSSYVPRCRTVVFRGFLDFPESSRNLIPDGGDHRNVLKFITDGRSEKVEQIKNQPLVEILWWFPDQNIQFRIEGIAALYGGEKSSIFADLRIKIWKEMKDRGREQFFWDNPGVSYTGAPYSIARKFDWRKVQEDEATI